MQEDKKYMKMCINLAKKGEGKTSPNPMVGAVLVDNKGIVLSKGYHKEYGKEHAEVDCIKNYEKKYGKKTNYKNLTLYVNLEPCNHFGMTPPCADMIIEKGIKKVVVGVKDPNIKHSGGTKKLKKAGIEVVTDILKNEAQSLNEVFFKNVNENKPFIALKCATTLDGKIAAKTGSSKWITSEKSRNYVQKLRNRYDAVLTSSNTVAADNPSLTVRKKGYKNPVRIILDSNLKTNPDSKVYNNDGVKVLLFYTEEKLKNKKESYPKNVELIKVSSKNGKISLPEAINKIYERGVTSILVETGGVLCGEFLKQNLVDKIYHFVAPKILGDNDAKSFVSGFDILNINECRNFKITTLKKLNPDIMIELYPI